MRKTLLLLLATIVLLGCGQRADTFCITGHIAGAADTMLYLEHLTLSEGAVPADSIRLGSDGAFCFRKKADAAPEFYRLRIGGQCINLSIDSTETVEVTANMADMSFGYRVEGSGACDTIRLLCLKLADLEREARRISLDRNFTLQERDSLIDGLVEKYKKSFCNFMLSSSSKTYGITTQRPTATTPAFRRSALSSSSTRCTTRAT